MIKLKTEVNKSAIMKQLRKEATEMYDAAYEGEYAIEQFLYGAERLFNLLRLPRVSGSLSIEQLEKADMWYCLHKNHVNKLYHLAENSLPPTLNEDKNNPSLWKAGHWKWYLDNYR